MSAHGPREADPPVSSPILERELAIVLWVGAAGSVTLVRDGQGQHDIGLADRAAVKAGDHLNVINVTLTLASTGGDLDLRPDRVPG